MNLPEKIENIDLNSSDDKICNICSNEFKKTLGVFNLSKKKCFVCKRHVCNNCLSKEERIKLDKTEKGIPCIECLESTKPITNKKGFKPKDNIFFPNTNLNDLMQIPDLINKLCEEIEDTKIDISSELKEIRNTIDDQISETRSFSNDFFQDKLLIVKGEIITEIESIIKRLTTIVEDQREKTQESIKNIADGLIDKTWTNIKKDIYKILLVIFSGTIILTGIITIEIKIILDLFK